MPDLDIEGKLTLSFPPGWQAIKLDDEAWYRDDLKSQVKAVDVVAAQGTSHWWIEVKDCAGFETDNLPRLSAAEPKAVDKVRQWVKQQGLDRDVQVKRCKPFIVDEVFEKFAGSIMCMVSAQRALQTSKNATALKPFLAAMCDDASLNVGLLLTWSGPEFKRLANRLSTKLQQRMTAFGVNCFVVDEVERLPGQPWRARRP